MFIYSIIIPHYNSPQLLQRMLDSIPQRDDIQVIVVDDASSEENVIEVKKCHHLNLETICLSDNHGAGYARNIGLDKAEGKWVLVVDADDMFSDNAFTVLDKYVDSEYDYISYCVKATNSELIERRTVRSDQYVRKYLKKRNDKTLLSFRFLNNVCWNKIVRMEFIRANNIHFENSIVNNDVLYNLTIGLKANKFEVISDELYYAIAVGDSITHQKRTIEREFLFFLQAQKRNGFYKKLGLKRYPFYRRTIFYFPYMWKKHGLSDTIKFFKMMRERKMEIEEARKAYLYLFE